MRSQNKRGRNIPTRHVAPNNNKQERRANTKKETHPGPIKKRKLRPIHKPDGDRRTITRDNVWIHPHPISPLNTPPPILPPQKENTDE